MLKRLSAIAAVFFLLAAFLSPVYADVSMPTSMDADTAINTATQQDGVPMTNQQEYWLQYIAPPPGLQVTVDGAKTDFGYLVYGSPHGDFSEGRYRYAGYDLYGEDVTNLAFRPDQNANGANFDEQDWVKEPWKNVSGTIETPYDGNKEYEPALWSGIYWLNTTTGAGGTGQGNGFAIDLNDGNALWGNLYQYAHILIPETTYTWGIARMWHWKDGSLWYTTIPLPPLIIIQQPQLVVTPSSASIGVGGTQQYTATYFPSGQANGSGQDVTTQSVWSDDNNSIATIGAGTGLATGASPGTTNITATYTPSGGERLTGAATLTVTGAPAGSQNPPSGSSGNGGNNPPDNPPDNPDNPPANPGSGTLTFQAVNQATVSTVPLYTLDGKPAKKITRPPNTAKWTDTVTATLAPAAPVPPKGSVTEWHITGATLTYPKMNPGFTFGGPLPPSGTQTASMAPDGHQATATFVEDWSHDGYGVYDILTRSHMAEQPKSYTITAAYTVQYTYKYKVQKLVNGSWETETVTKTDTRSGAASGALLVNGAGAAPVTSGNKMVIVSVN